MINYDDLIQLHKDVHNVNPSIAKLFQIIDEDRRKDYDKLFAQIVELKSRIKLLEEGNATDSN